MTSARRSVAKPEVRASVMGNGSGDHIASLRLPQIEELRSGAFNVSGGESPQQAARGVEERLAASFEEGFAEGRSVGEREAQSRLDAERERCNVGATSLEAVLRSLSVASKEIAETNAGDVARFAFELAKGILGMDPSVELERLVTVVKDTLSGLDPDLDIRIRVNPSQIEFLRESLPRENLPLAGALELLADPQIEPAGAIVEAGPSRIDTQITSLVEKVAATLFEVGGAR